MVDERKAPEGYKVTEVGIMPDDWEVKKLGEVLNNPKLGGNYSNSTSITQYPLIKMGNISRGSILVDKIEFIEEGIKPSKLHRLKYGDVLFNTRNTLDLVGKVGIWKDELPEAYYNSNLLLLDFHKSFVASTFFMNYVLNIKSSIVQLRNVATGTTSVAAIYSRDLYKILVPLPPKPEQKSIAEALSNTDNLIISLEKLIDKKKKIKQGMMQQLLTGKKRLPGFSGEWEEVNLGDICSRITTGKLDANAMKTDGIYRFYTCAKEYYWIDKYSFDDEALLISGNGANVGYIHYYKGKFNAYQRTYVLTGFFESIIYVKYYLEKYLADRISAEVNAGNTPYIKMDTLTDMIIKLPPQKDEQKAIAQILSDMDAEIEALEEKLEKVKTIKQGMMQELLTGRIRLI